MTARYRGWSIEANARRLVMEAVRDAHPDAELNLPDGEDEHEATSFSFERDGHVYVVEVSMIK